jgi:hypothetical protein
MPKVGQTGRGKPSIPALKQKARPATLTPQQRSEALAQGASIVEFWQGQRLGAARPPRAGRH